MPNLLWSQLNRMQLGRYAEYYAKMEFSSYGFEVYGSEVDDRGIDFVVRNPKDKLFYEVQVKSIRNTGYVFMKKEHMMLSANRLICLLIFSENSLPEVFIIPAKAWLTPDSLLVEHNYEKAGQKSAPEWGINLSKKNMPLLECFRAHNFFEIIAK